MKLTKKQVIYNAFCEWRENEHFVDGHYPTEEMIWNAATERMQDENAKLQKVIDKYAQHLSSCDVFPLHAGGPAGPCSCELKDALSKAGLDQREAKGDGG